jgi:hypothetical protein
MIGMGSYVEQSEPRAFVDKRRGRGQNTNAVSTPLNYSSDSNLETRLAAISAGYYTTARLAQMTLTDKIYAVRTSDDAAGIK